jgi:hypothetical protein
MKPASRSCSEDESDHWNARVVRRPPAPLPREPPAARQSTSVKA